MVTAIDMLSSIYPFPQRSSFVICDWISSLSGAKTLWFTLSDTVYTERYMGLDRPEDNFAGYTVRHHFVQILSP